ncbi:hypothetical protein AAF712_006785 [Marasmius tenuissimus]|uniref:F-box domain-containing protein n=1 Tax=Marasmius tenuissimus TaxID=585030 RepID=A0ABR2ZXX0_9AGAR
MSLLKLPIEVLDNIAFHVACPAIEGLPEDLSSFFLASPHIYRNLKDSPALHARIFKFKFSFSAISRRAFTPKSKEYAWQLKWFTQVLFLVRRRSAALPNLQLAFGEQDPDEPSVSELLFALWIMCLEDDGCNRLQMESVGAYDWVKAFVHNQLYEKTEAGWPVEDAKNPLALWVMWYLTTKARLLSEPVADRQRLVNLILPFVTLPYRYPAAFAPPNHFHLPLAGGGPQAIDDSPDISSAPTPHGRYPIYLSSDRTWLHVHFDRRTPTTIPLASDSAKLLYFSRRELSQFGIPPHLPPTREAHRERLRQRFIADAERDGHALTPLELQRLIAAEPAAPTQEDIHEMNASLLGGELAPHPSFGRGGGTALTTTPSVVVDPSGRVLEVDESACASQRWDNDWWRLRQCRSCWKGDESADVEEPPHGDMMAGVPKQGRVYKPGSLTGLWSGRMLVPSQNHLEALLQPRGPQPQDGRAVHPRPEEFNENVAGLMTVPVFMRLEEHVSYAPSPVIPPGGRETFDQGICNGYFPDGMEHKKSSDGKGVVFTVPPTSSNPRTKEYVYHTLSARDREGLSRDPQPGRFHDVDTCPGCRAAETARRSVRLEEESPDQEQEDGIDSKSDGHSSCDEEEEEEADPHDPHKILDCDGVQDITVTGETDERHGEAWNHFTFHGRVRHHDGMVGILRRRRKGVGNVFFYGTIIGGTNFVGNWRVADVDPTTPAWEGAFSLGKKIE